ncbi:MAG: hypothetical protein ACREV7_04300 [Steroidobacteraceae bacterium]
MKAHHEIDFSALVRTGEHHIADATSPPVMRALPPVSAIALVRFVPCTRNCQWVETSVTSPALTML